MDIIHNILDQDFQFDSSTTLTIGNFDGIHRGHSSIFEKVISIARKNGTIGAVVTFDPHPSTILTPDRLPRLLTTTQEKLDILESANVPTVILIPFDKRFSQHSAVWFLEEILIRKLRATHIVIGVNHAFGRNREGDVDFLKNVLPEKGIALDVVKPVRESKEMVSSSAVRSIMNDGDFGNAIKMLGHPYPLYGRVVPGRGIGKALGYPTINIQVIKEKLIPASGVYACSLHIDRRTIGGMLYIGTRPTFDGKTKVIEISCFEPLDIQIGDCLKSFALRYFRQDMKFESPDLLVEQMRWDEKMISSFLGKQKIKLTSG